VILFGIFLISVGILMFCRPNKAREYIRKAGSTVFIHFSELTIRMIPAAALIIYADASKFQEIFKILGWFMIATSLILYFVPRRLHHNYAKGCANKLKPLYIQIISPFSIFFGACFIYAVI
jgi:uncharacterized membrane protein YfcA